MPTLHADDPASDEEEDQDYPEDEASQENSDDTPVGSPAYGWRLGYMNDPPRGSSRAEEESESQSSSQSEEEEASAAGSQKPQSQAEGGENEGTKIVGKVEDEKETAVKEDGGSGKEK